MTHLKLSRRSLMVGLAATVLATRSAPLGAQSATERVMHVTKTPTCGCCGAWIDMARAHGFTVEVTDTRDYAGMKKANGVPKRLVSCHTATIDGYVVEGHVPFAAIDHMLATRPDIKGISVPGMPGDSPGMGGGQDAIVPVTAWGGAAGGAAPYEFGD
ncbi:CopG family transcriptional regulator [Lutimaribacter sp. EGI FJ00015]|uniref:CopG family transcriptional regulator n=1 Tax=Lutimaribacter degradans TaxID=2945989 RepID=A0ACC5ZTK4_9RHOB|nr:DUF411 domain-containing protein [Lutimaribacter sp. EGI FJ00013]MCM2561508.1 CopG family transcriptional regulator [Lutimaribacter sp. EGI FJ00013]MCO0612781.1 CopG family transcriptional regulator [Lutimaribacter sp. EGI FJ00015]MCO0635439.1 CopG family transcriptional regulator [Lutimaribacter sp. EGI FJ00014]